MILVRDIQRATAQHHNLPIETMTEPGTAGGRQWKHAHPRQEAMYIASRLTKHSYKRIGKLFGGRDHTTVLHALSQVEKRLRTDPEVVKDVRAVAHKLLLEDGQ